MAFNQRIGRATLELSIEGGAFVRGAADAKATMRDLARGIAQTQRDISKQAFQFSGRQQIADAAKVVEAVKRIGGATKLVATDQAKVNAVVKQGIEYYKVLGREAPKAWHDIAQATQKVDKGFLGLTGTLGMVGRSIAGAFGGFVGVSAIIGAARQTLEYADSLEKASVAAGGTAEQVQRLENIAVNSNTTLDALVRSLTTLQDRIAGEDPKAIDALKELRLDAEQLLALSPDKQLIAIANAMQRIQSHARQISLTKDLFGIGGVEVFGALSKDAETFADSVKKLSDDQVKQLASMKAGWDSLTLSIRRTFSEIALNNVNAMLGRFPASQAARDAFERQQLLSNQRVGDVRLAPELPPNYTKDLRDAQAALKGLNKETLAQLDAAKKLATTTDADLSGILRRAGIEGAKAKNVIKLLNDTLKDHKKDVNEAAREWQQMLERFNGATQRLESNKIASAIATGQLNLAKMTTEAQQAISKALEDGAAAWKAWGGIVPAEINRARAAVATLPQMVDELRKLETPPPNATVPEGDAAIANQGIEDSFRRAGGAVEGMKTRAAAARDHAKVLRDLDIQRSEAVIRQAEREGAKKAQLLVMESVLEQKKRDAEIADAEASLAADEDALQERLRRGEIETSQYQAELDRRQQAHKDHVQQINEQWEQGEAERRDMIRRESSFWATELGKRIKGELQGILHEATGRLASTLFGRVDDAAKQRAKEAREDYESIARSGRASAEEITRAFRAMRQAEEAAQTKWADRFKGIWDSIKRHIFNIFDSILESFVNGLLKGLWKSLSGSGFGQRLGGWIGGLFGGGGGGGGFGEIGGLPVGSEAARTIFGGGGGFMPSLLSKIPGVGRFLGGGAGGVGLLGSADAPALSTLLGTPPAGATAATTTTSAVSGVLGKALPIAGAAIGTYGLIKGGSLGSNLLNGVTAGASIGTLVLPGIGTAIGAGLGAIAGGLRSMFGGGNQRVEGFGPSRRLMAQIEQQRRPAPMMTPALDAALSIPDTFRSTNRLAPSEVLRAQRDRGGSTVFSPTYTINVSTQDAEGFERVWERKIRPRIIRDMGNNAGALGSRVRETAAK